MLLKVTLNTIWWWWYRHFRLNIKRNITRLFIAFISPQTLNDNTYFLLVITAKSWKNHFCQSFIFDSIYYNRLLSKHWHVKFVIEKWRTLFISQRSSGAWSVIFCFVDNNFDLPDRTFHNMETCWRLASFQSSTDFKEMIPEFFFLPEFLNNFEGKNFHPNFQISSLFF